MGNGRKGKAPCGHDGEAIIGHYYECLEGCGSAIPTYIDPEKTKQLCIHCMSSDIAIFPDFALSGKTIYYCHTCFRVFEVDE